MKKVELRTGWLWNRPYVGDRISKYIRPALSVDVEPVLKPPTPTPEKHRPMGLGK